MATTHAIRFRCKCGHIMKTSLKHAGQKTRCPKCQGKVRVPVPSPRKSESRKVNTSQQEESLDLGAFMLDASVDDGGEVMALDDFSLDEPVESDSGYDLADEDDADPAWMQHADNAPPIPQQSSGMSRSAGSEKPTVVDLFKAEYGGTIFLGIFAIAWGLVAIYAITGFDPIGFLTDASDSDIKTTVMGEAKIIGILTLLASPVIVWRYYEMWGILNNRVELTGHVTKSGILSKHGSVSVTITYRFDGRDYDFRTSMKKPSVGDSVELIINRKKPKRARLAN